MDATHRVEPKGITLSDLMVVVAGVAIGYGLGPITMEPSISTIFLGAQEIRFHFPYIPSNRPVYIAAFAISLAVLVRRARYGGWPRVGDWPALVAAAHLLSMVILFRAYELAFSGHGMNEWEGQPLWRPDQWPWAAIWSLAAVIGMVLLARLRNRLPGWAGAIGILLVATMFLCGPVHVFAENYDPFMLMDDTVNPSPNDVRWHYLRTDGYLHLFLWPEWLLYGLPTMSAIFDLRRNGPRSWFWTEWASLAMMLALAAFYCLECFSFIDPMGFWTLSIVMVRALLLVGVTLVSWLIIKVFTVFRNRRPAIRSLQFHEKGDRVE